MRLLFPMTTIVFVLLSSVCKAARYTFWQHSSCNEKQIFNDALKEAFEAAKKAVDWLQQYGNIKPDAHTIFERLFKTSTKDQMALTKVKGSPSSLSLSETHLKSCQISFLGGYRVGSSQR